MGPNWCTSILGGLCQSIPGTSVMAFTIWELSINSDGRLWRRRAPPAMALQLVVPNSDQRGFIQRYHDSIFAGHLGISRTVCRLLDRVYWPGLHDDVWSYIASCSVCLARKSPCPRRVPMGHVSVGHRWDRVAMDILDMSVTMKDKTY